MRFRELRIEASEKVADRGVVLPGLVFRWTAHHVREIFSAMLPRDYTLDGSSVFQVTCGPRGSERQYAQRLGSSEYFVEDFDFVGYANASPAHRERMLLDVVEAALCDIAERVGAELSVIAATAQAVRERSFRLDKEVSKLRKRIPGSACVLRVRRSFSAELGETWFLWVTERDGTILKEVVMGDSPEYLDRRDFYKKSELQGTTFIVRSRLDKETFRFDFGDMK